MRSLKFKIHSVAGRTKRIIQINNRVHLNKTIFYVVVYPHTIDGVEGTLAVCFNGQQRKDLRESRYEEIEYTQVLLEKGQRIKAGLVKFF